jgi:predicted phage tail protein
MALFVKRTDLDLWATALGVNNDDDALQVLRQVLAQVDAAAQQLRTAWHKVADAPDDEARKHIAKALTEAVVAVDELRHVQKSFRLHERGR